MPSDFEESLEKDVSEAYEQFKMKKSNDQNYETVAHESILGHCVEASEFLQAYLRSNQYNAKIVNGAYNYPKEPTPASYDDAKKTGTIHHWVQVDHQNDRYFCDIAPTDMKYVNGGSSGYLFYKNTLPAEYIRF